MDQIVKIADEKTIPTTEDSLMPAEGKSNQSDKEKKKGFVAKVKETFNPSSTFKPVSSATVHSRFIIGDHVVLQPVDSAPIKGIVRWVGPVRTSKETGGIIIPVVGVETVSYN